MDNQAASIDLFKQQLKKRKDEIEAALEHFLPKSSRQTNELCDAVRYSVLNGGKRVRPLLTILVAEMLEGDSREAVIAASAIEMIHSYSLVHDDLPCLDNDDIRRGRPTCHKKFGEPLALLAGDGLLTLSFHILSELKDTRHLRRLVSEISQAAGIFGMVAGQAMDILTENREVSLAALESIHIHKTGQLIKVSCLAGAVVANATQEIEQHILKFGEYLGFAFQIVDDILDGDGYLKHMSLHEAREKAADLVLKAKQELHHFDRNTSLLCLADSILERGSSEN